MTSATLSRYAGAIWSSGTTWAGSGCRVPPRRLDGPAPAETIAPRPRASTASVRHAKRGFMGTPARIDEWNEAHAPQPRARRGVLSSGSAPPRPVQPGDPATRRGTGDQDRGEPRGAGRRPALPSSLPIDRIDPAQT